MPSTIPYGVLIPWASDQNHGGDQSETRFGHDEYVYDKS